jgi:hypothetical protein
MENPSLQSGFYSHGTVGAPFNLANLSLRRSVL